MKVIGLTGGIGSGKSTVAKFLSEMGAYILDADKIGHEAFKPGTPGWQEVFGAFGKDILKENNEIDRSKLAQLVFGKPEALANLNKIMHPRILEIVKNRLDLLKRRGVKVAVLEATLLIEAGWRPIVDETWVTVASKRETLKRLKERDNYSEGESLIRIRSQITSKERAKTADVVINTDCSLEEVRMKIEELWHERITY